MGNDRQLCAVATHSFTALTSASLVGVLHSSVQILDQIRDCSQHSV